MSPSRAMHWVARTLRGKVVYARANAAGEPEVGDDGRVDIIYQKRPGAKVYRASSRNLGAADSDDEGVLVLDLGDLPRAEDRRADDKVKPGTKGAGRGGKRPGRAGDWELLRVDGELAYARRAKSGDLEVDRDGPPDDAIVIYTDGACSGNPGPMGVGAVILDRGERIEISEYLGMGTNNIAELTAIGDALATIEAADRTRPVWLHTDSSYSIGLLSKNWKAKANAELVARLRTLVATFDRLKFIKVKGHAGIAENERCDELATGAISGR